jgi:hypothetical protein
VKYVISNGAKRSEKSQSHQAMLQKAKKDFSLAPEMKGWSEW